MFHFCHCRYDFLSLPLRYLSLPLQFLSLPFQFLSLPLRFLSLPFRFFVIAVTVFVHLRVFSMKHVSFFVITILVFGTAIFVIAITLVFCIKSYLYQYLS